MSLAISLSMEAFPSSAWKYIYEECIKPFKKQFIFCVFLVFASSAVYNLLNWFFAQLIDTIKDGVSEEVLRKAIVFVLLILACEIINIYLPKLQLMYRQKELYFPVRERIFTKALAYIFGHSTNYIINKQTGSLLARTNQISETDQVLSILIVIFWSQLSEVIIKVTLLSYVNVSKYIWFVLKNSFH